jgi:hypothetical protein
VGNDDLVFHRDGNFVRFNQRGVKIMFPNDVPDQPYYNWLDDITRDIGNKVPGSQIVEKSIEREQPRRNSGTYYDTEQYDLLHGHMALRTTSNPKTHAFCAFKFGEDESGVRRDHRYVFEGEDKVTIQQGPSSPAAVRAVHRLLERRDIVHPGTVMEESTGISGDSLTPVLSVIQDRRTFYVWLDGKDALRCSLDRASVAALRPTFGQVASGFSEVELAIFPRISPELIADSRTWRVLDCLAESLATRFEVRIIKDSKYRRAAFEIGLLPEVR